MIKCGSYQTKSICLDLNHQSIYESVYVDSVQTTHQPIYIQIYSHPIHSISISKQYDEQQKMQTTENMCIIMIERVPQKNHKNFGLIDFMVKMRLISTQNTICMPVGQEMIF